MPSNRRPPSRDQDPNLAELDRKALEAIIEAAAVRHEDVASAVRLAIARGSGHADQLRAEIDRSLRTRRFLGYYESRTWAADAAPVVNAIRDAVQRDPSSELVALIQRAVGHVVKVIFHADDSDGLIGDIARDLLDLHAVACDSGCADPVKLARWMVRFCFDDQDFFELDPVRYASALGGQGLDAYRREVERRCEAGDRSFAAKYAQERLAVHDGEPEAIIRLLGGGLSRPYDFIRVAEAMEELGRDEDVLLWAKRGIAETSGWQVAQLYELIAGVLRRGGLRREVVELRHDQHQHMPSASTYALLKIASEDGGVWQTECPWARAQLADRDLGGLVDVLLDDGEPDAAWQVATKNPSWEPGDRRWMRLAEGRAPGHPSDALKVYLRLADVELETTGRAAYVRATATLKKAANSAISAHRTGEFAAHMQILRDRHRRRPTLIQMLDRAGLG